jgi:hypothetical protein
MSPGDEHQASLSTFLFDDAAGPPRPRRCAMYHHLGSIYRLFNHSPFHLSLSQFGEHDRRTTVTTRSSLRLLRGGVTCIIISIGTGATQDTIDADTLGRRAGGGSGGRMGHLERLAPRREPAHGGGGSALSRIALASLDPNVYATSPFYTIIMDALMALFFSQKISRDSNPIANAPC